jgi:hypothetical protein
MQVTSSSARDEAIIAAYTTGDKVKEIKERFGIPNDPAFYKVLDSHGIGRRNRPPAKDVPPPARTADGASATFRVTTRVEQTIVASDVWMVVARAEAIPGAVEILEIERVD